MSRFTTYSAIQNGIASLAGFDPAAVHDDTWRTWRQLVSDRLTYAWEAETWPDICVVEERTVTDNSTDDYVPFTEANKNEIGEVFGVWSADPITSSNAKQLGFFLESHGISIPNGHTTVYVYYRKQKPELTGYFIDAATTYAADSQVYDSTTGDFYNAILSNAPTHDLSDATRWERIQIPLIFKQYLIRGVTADYYRHNQEYERSRELAPLAEYALDHELIKYKTQQNQKKNFTSTRQNLQAY